MSSTEPGHLSRAEITKDATQSVTEAAATMVGEVTSIVTGAVKAVAGSVGEFASEVFEIRESSRRARADAEPLSEASSGQAADDAGDAGEQPGL